MRAPVTTNTRSPSPVPERRRSATPSFVERAARLARPRPARRWVRLARPGFVAHQLARRRGLDGSVARRILVAAARPRHEWRPQPAAVIGKPWITGAPLPAAVNSPRRAFVMHRATPTVELVATSTSRFAARIHSSVSTPLGVFHNFHSQARERRACAQARRNGSLQHPPRRACIRD